jgi:hypothetical protein
LDGVDEALNVAALAATLPAELFQFHAEAEAGGVFSNEERTATRVVDGACIFLNRPGMRAAPAVRCTSVLSHTASRQWSGSRRCAGSCP